MWKDEIIEALHASREAHARRFGFDLRAICADLQAQEKSSGRHFVTLAPKPARAAQTGAKREELAAR
jgi:hypothetical protein